MQPLLAFTVGIFFLGGFLSLLVYVVLLFAVSKSKKQQPRWKRYSRIQTIVAFGWFALFVFARVEGLPLLAPHTMPPEWETKTNLEIMQVAIAQGIKDHAFQGCPTPHALITNQYLVRIPVDGWGRGIQVRCGADGSVAVSSAGRDGVAGTTDDLMVSIDMNGNRR